MIKNKFSKNAFIEIALKKISFPVGVINQKLKSMAHINHYKNISFKS